MRYVIRLLLLCILAGTAASATAAEAITIVHEEQVQVGPYQVTVGFSRWPLHADRSLDIVFMPAGGIDGLSGEVILVAPDGDEERTNLVRHPRMRSAWGLDVIALPEEGPWSMVFTIDGAAGPGTGRLAPIILNTRPGPSLAIGWAISLLPLLGLITMLVAVWRRVRPAHRADTWSWM